jgi:prolyl oligopeptidase
MDGKPRKLLDPNVFDKDGVFSITTSSISNDGKYVAYALSENGSDWQVIKVRDVGCGHDMDDTLRYLKLTSIGWTQDSKGFFYQVIISKHI